MLDLKTKLENGANTSEFVFARKPIASTGIVQLARWCIDKSMIS